MLIDEIEITLQAGHGGAGKVSFNPGKKGGPNGGNGGRGGDIYIKAASDLTVLNQFSKQRLIKAENGQPGDVFQKTGRDGKDLQILMPLGTYLKDKETGEVFEIGNLNDCLLIAKGGLGGRGNFELRSSRNTTPRYAQKGLPGQQRNLKAELKFLADIGLIGLPNAGKSSLLNELTAANAKTADYPFTTLEPNLGVWQRKIIADIPGLIAGASKGKGLGIKFLKHIEKVRLLLHCVASDSKDPAADYLIVRDELAKFNPKTAEKKEIVLLTKSDLLTKKDLKLKIQALRKVNKTAFPVSIYDWDSLKKLEEILKSSLNQ